MLWDTFQQKSKTKQKIKLKKNRGLVHGPGPKGESMFCPFPLMNCLFRTWQIKKLPLPKCITLLLHHMVFRVNA